MTLWTDETRIKRIRFEIENIRHTLGLIDRILSHLKGGKDPIEALDTRDKEFAP